MVVSMKNNLILQMVIPRQAIYEHYWFGEKGKGFAGIPFKGVGSGEGFPWVKEAK